MLFAAADSATFLTLENPRDSARREPEWPLLNGRSMRLSTIVLTLMTATACGTLADGPDALDGNPNGESSQPTFEGLPCAVAELLETHCVACHGSPPANDVPMSLVTHADLMRPSPSDPSRTVAEMCLARMKDSIDPMPPGGMLAADAILAFEEWLAAGAPQGECGPAGGSGPGVVCSSDAYWEWDSEPPNEDQEPEMNPGRTCIKCHTDETLMGEEAPLFSVAGTVYPTVHEPDLCLGVEGAVVEVIDALGRVVTMTTNASGNFFYEDEVALTFPIRAKLTYDGNTIAMSDPVDTGDCNSCHTQDGAQMAPGRIHLP